jgi:uncharacterized membrane protein YcaP (DUF421 family)
MQFESLWQNLWHSLAGGDRPEHPLDPHQVVVRTLLIYLIGLALIRAGKSRLIGRVTSLDVLLGFILGSLLSRGMTGSAGISETTISAAALIAGHWALTYGACRWHWFGILVKGHTAVLVEHGQVHEGNLRHSHLSQHDLEESLRINGVEKVDEVRLAVKERNGEVSVIKEKGGG